MDRVTVECYTYACSGNAIWFYKNTFHKFYILKIENFLQIIFEIGFFFLVDSTALL